MGPDETDGETRNCRTWSWTSSSPGKVPGTGPTTSMTGTGDYHTLTKEYQYQEE
jgi:hypothetical protein